MARVVETVIFKHGETLRFNSRQAMFMDKMRRDWLRAVRKLIQKDKFIPNENWDRELKVYIQKIIARLDKDLLQF
jgi:hypothetical protein